MRKALLVLLGVVWGLSACGTGLNAATLPATLPSNEATSPPVITTAVPTITPLVLTTTPTTLPPTTTPLILSQLDMVDALNGWGWVANADFTYRLLRTHDGAHSWNDITPADIPLIPSGAFFLNDQYAWVPTLNPQTGTVKLARTTDGGNTWMISADEQALNPGYTFEDVLTGWAIMIDVGAGNSFVTIQHTADGGTTWTPFIITPPTPEPSLPKGTIHLCNICGDMFYVDSKRVVITHGDLATDPSGAVHFELSTDLGQHWQAFSLTLPADYQDGLVVPRQPHFFGAADGVLPVGISKTSSAGASIYNVLAIYITHDGGQTWTLSSAVVKEVDMFAPIQIPSIQDVTALCGSKLCITHDGAQTWQSFDGPAAANSGAQYDFINGNTGWALVPGEYLAATLYQTTDGGATWDQIIP